MRLYLTQDRIGTPTGGGAVTYHEYQALASMGGETHPIDGARIPFTDPFSTDNEFARLISSASGVKLAHIYAGCFTKTVEALKKAGAKVSYTAAAHDIKESRREFEELGIPFNFPHLTQPDLWEKYVGGYKAADLVICPSTLSKKMMESYGCKNVVVIPHGCEIPKEVKPLPKRLTVGYLGSATGPDKGLIYLLKAWKELAYKDATLIVAGRDSTDIMPTVRAFAGGNIHLAGWQDSVSDFYNQISLFVAPSVTEGFNIEVLESMAHRRVSICSVGAGVADLALKTIPIRNVSAIASAIDYFRTCPDELKRLGNEARAIAEQNTWEIVKKKYIKIWKGLLGPSNDP